MSGKKFRSLGNSGLQYTAPLVYEEFLTQLRYPQAANIYQEMSTNDPVIGAILFMAEQLIRKAGWRVEAVSDSPADKEAADFLESCMNDMSTSWEDFITDALSMLTYGFSFHEIIYKVRRGPDETNPIYKSKYSDGRIGWRKLAGRSQKTLYGWKFDEDGDAVAFIQQAPPTYKIVEIPFSKGLLFRTTCVRNNPEGRSLLRNAYRPWYFKKRIEEIEGIGIERDLAGLPVLQSPPNVDLWANDAESTKLRAAAENLVQSIRRDENEGVILPDGWTLTLLSTGGSRQFDTSQIINRYDQRIAITLLSDIVLLGGDKVGSFALGEMKKSLLAATLESTVHNMADTINQFAVKDLFQMNYFPNIVELPKIVPGEVETPDLSDLAFILRATNLDIYSDLGLMNLIRRLLSLKELTQEDLDDMNQKKMEAQSSMMNNEADSNNKTLSRFKDPVGHSMDDTAHDFEV